MWCYLTKLNNKKFQALTLRHPPVSSDQDLAVPSNDPDIRISPALIGNPLENIMSSSEGMKSSGRTPFLCPLKTLIQALLSCPSSRSLQKYKGC